MKGSCDNRLDALTWRAFCRSLLQRGDDGEAVRFGGHRLNESQTRNMHRYVRGELGRAVEPTLFSADRLLVAVGVHIEDYFAFASARGLRAWRSGEPFWHTQTIDAEAIAEWRVLDGEPGAAHATRARPKQRQAA